MQNMKNCPQHGPYPARFEECPICNPNAKSEHTGPLSTEQMLTRMSDEQVQHVFSHVLWEAGNPIARKLCRAEYEQRFGPNSWPIHIEKE